jgi:hypothetical protein
MMVELKGDKVIMRPLTMIEKRLAEGLDDFRKGRIYGPFASGAEAVDSLHKNAKTKSV